MKPSWSTLPAALDLAQGRQGARQVQGDRLLAEGGQPGPGRPGDEIRVGRGGRGDHDGVHPRAEDLVGGGGGGRPRSAPRPVRRGRRRRPRPPGRRPPGWRARTPAWKEPIRPVPMSPMRMHPTCRPPGALSTICPDKSKGVARTVRGTLPAVAKPTADSAALGLGVDRTSPVPLYFQLAQQLEAAIEQGRLAPGSLLGNEIELAARLGLSRPTVRQAIQSLVDKGLLVRRRGVGTQVVHSQVKRPLELSSLYDDLEAAGQRPATRVLRNTVEPADARGRRRARRRGGRRGPSRRAAAATPTASRWRYLRNHLPPDLLDLDTERLESTGLYRMMRARGHHPAQRPAVRRRPRRHRRGGRAARRARGGPAAHDGAHHLRRHAAGRSSSARTSTGPRATPSSSSCSSGPERPAARRPVRMFGQSIDAVMLGR